MAQIQAESLQVLNSILDQRAKQPLSILALAEPLLHASSPLTRQSTHSDPNFDSEPLDPRILNADLEHYRDLFSKLRFSYLEQVSKEKYLRAIVGEPPLIATIEDNAALEEKLVELKSELQTKKRASEAIVLELEGLAKDIAARYDRINTEMQLLEELPGEIQVLENEVDSLKRRLADYDNEVGDEVVDTNPRMNLSLEETQRILHEQQQWNEALQEQISQLESKMTATSRECEQAERELEETEARRNEITRSIRDMEGRTRKEGRNTMEARGRWLRSEKDVLREVLGLQDGG